MELLVKFIAVDNREQIDSNYDYVNYIYKEINAGGLIKSLNIQPDAAAFGVGGIIELDEDGNVFQLNFNSKEEQKSNIWSIYFVYGTYSNLKQLEIAIYSDTYIPEVDEGYLEKLKLKIKKCISRDWDKIIWLVDKDSECLSIYLYPQIYKVENLMREVINEIMVKQYGMSWWETFVPESIKEKYSKRLKEYKLKVPSFRDVDDRLMAIDIDDLGVIIKLQRYKWNPVFSERISKQLNGVQKYSEGVIQDELYKQRVVETDLWDEQFSKYLPEDFNDRYALFAKDRNHIMHNKVIDRVAFRTMRELIEQLECDITKAIKKVQNEILSNEEKMEIEKQKEIERRMLEELDHECRENDANVSIRDSGEIEELFQDSIAQFLTGIEEKLRFRNDLDISIEYEVNAYNGKLFVVQSRVDEKCLDFFFDMNIIDSEGADSTLKVYCTTEDFKTYIEYRNGAVEYDSDSGLYMPITEDEIDDVDSIIDETVDFIDTEIQNYMENANPEDIIEYLYCCECGTDAICINENVLPVGTCMNCGFVNEVHECNRCNSWFNSDEDGRIIDDVAFCQNCLDEMEEE